MISTVNSYLRAKTESIGLALVDFIALTDRLKNKILNIIIFIYRIAEASFLTKNTIIYIGPSSRRRYLKYYINKDNIKFIPCPNPILLFTLPLLRLRREHEIFISDIFFFKNCEYKKLAIILNALKCRWIIWNDKLELHSIPRSIRLSVQVLSFFNETGCNIIRPSAIARRHPTHPATRKQHIICFAGQANERIYKNELASQEYLLEYIYENYLHLNPVKIFSFSEKHGKNITESLGIKFRHQCINLWRKLLIQRMTQDFHGRMLLVGPDFLSPEFSAAMRLANLSEIDTMKMYATSRVCLDLGSQCGLQPLYPRSLEILSVNSAGLVQAEIDKSTKLFSNSVFSHCGASYAEMASCIEKLLSITDDEYLREGEILYNNTRCIIYEYAKNPKIN